MRGPRGTGSGDTARGNPLYIFRVYHCGLLGKTVKEKQMQAAGGTFDAQLYLELNRALVSSDGDAALVALADLIRCRHIRVSEDAWAFLRYAVRAQRRSSNAEQTPEGAAWRAFRPAERNL